MAVVDEYVLPPDVTQAYKDAERSPRKKTSEYITSGKWKGYTPHGALVPRQSGGHKNWNQIDLYDSLLNLADKIEIHRRLCLEVDSFICILPG